MIRDPLRDPAMRPATIPSHDPSAQKSARPGRRCDTSAQHGRLPIRLIPVENEGPESECLTVFVATIRCGSKRYSVLRHVLEDWPLAYAMPVGRAKMVGECGSNCSSVPGTSPRAREHAQESRQRLPRAKLSD